ncbi:TolA-binding protein [Lewinella marina]|uniref:Tetratricopeptide repeat protein n=1 Tax=Neolewinella marina TaxID=438751 RepID=A0A2G0CD23_9BACT|nr:hypothetical protein [Neolewinella marina]NJB86925.1 TolA-binding protein [Neolewinella marina]PHK97878.1 hypothetical protein CGL56_13780 [Neolewinella marina]
MNHDEQQERIDDYLRGRLPTPQVFERDLQAHPQLQSEMEATRLALDAIDISEHQRLKSRLQRLEAERAPVEGAGARVIPIHRRKHRRLLTYVAATALLLFLAGYFILAPDGTESALLAARTVEPYENIAYPITKSGEATDDARAVAYVAYESGDYARAAEAFRGLSDAEPADRFYLAQSLLAEGSFDEAATHFGALASRNDFNLAPESAFYRAVARLGTGEVVDAKAELSRIADTPGHPFRGEAERLLNNL